MKPLQWLACSNRVHLPSRASRCPDRPSHLPGQPGAIVPAPPEQRRAASGLAGMIAWWVTSHRNGQAEGEA
jgi:hypothetical protein